MLLINYECGRTRPMDGLESFCRLEGMDYPYIKAGVEAKSERKCKNNPGHREPDKNQFSFSL